MKEHPICHMWVSQGQVRGNRYAFVLYLEEIRIKMKKILKHLKRRYIPVPCWYHIWEIAMRLTIHTSYNDLVFLWVISLLWKLNFVFDTKHHYLGRGFWQHAKFVRDSEESANGGTSRSSKGAKGSCCVCICTPE